MDREEAHSKTFVRFLCRFLRNIFRVNRRALLLQDFSDFFMAPETQRFLTAVIKHVNAGLNAYSVTALTNTSASREMKAGSDIS